MHFSPNFSPPQPFSKSMDLYTSPVSLLPTVAYTYLFQHTALAMSEPLVSM
jgi:hypothetical protein